MRCSEPLRTSRYLLPPPPCQLRVRWDVPNGTSDTHAIDHILDDRCNAVDTAKAFVEGCPTLLRPFNCGGKPSTTTS
jgi:hypothetical protein